MTIDPNLETIHDAMSDIPGLTRSTAALVVRLNESKGRIVLYGDLQLALEAATGNGTTIESVRSTVKRARKFIGGYLVIRTANGVGYSMHRARLTPGT